MGASLLLIAVAPVLSSCGGSETASLPADPRVVLEAHISHGIGDSPFDSRLVSDSLAAAMILRARDCAPTELLIGLSEDRDEGGRMLEQALADGLVVIREGRACTTFPVLINEAQASYAGMTRGVAEVALEVFAADLVALSEGLEERGWQEWQYHFVWSQLFDSQFAWTEMMQRELVPPLGHLIAWVIYPDHPFRSGTNYYPDNELRDEWLMVTWRPGAANTVGLIGASWEIIYGAAVEERSLTGEERATLANLGLVDDTGLLNVPVLRSGDPLLDLLRSIAVRYVTFLEQRMPLDSLVALARIDRQHAFAMGYHDIGWEIVGQLVASGLVQVPPALEGGASDADPGMRGVTALTPAYAPFVDLIRAAIGSG